MEIANKPIEPETSAKPRGVGAQPGNANALKHGRHLTVGRLGPGMGYIKSLVSQFRRAVERAIQEAGRTLGEYERLRLQSACRHEQNSLVAQWGLRNCKSELDIPDLAAEVARATAERDKVLLSMGLDKPLSRPRFPTVPRPRVEASHEGAAGER